MNKALIFDIERFSTKDGPGIRTVVFFKGCNLNCRWCHNPEGILPAPQLLYNPIKCIACEKCAEICPQNAHLFQDGMHAFLPERCTNCLKCAEKCFSGAITVAGKHMTVEEILAELQQDADLYRKTGGGVTLSGGEVMLQADFACALLKRCKEEGFSTCIETNFTLPWERYEFVLPHLDYIFADIKHIDSAKHKEWTGVENSQILSNIKQLMEASLPFSVRTPIIPGFNDDKAAVTGIANLLCGCKNLQYYELLTYNPLGMSKGTVVGSEPQTKYPVPAHSKMEELALSAAGTIQVRLDGKEMQ